ncbi:MAG: hypothetical protein R3C42_00580 [Parvularculaceae bacterium]
MTSCERCARLFNVLGPLLAGGKARVSLPGGCAIGARPVGVFHLKPLAAIGMKSNSTKDTSIALARDGLHGATIKFPFVSVGATEHAMLAAALAKNWLPRRKMRRVNPKSSISPIA